MRELFIYWRTSAQNAGDAVQAARAWQDRLRHEYPHLRVALYRRDEAVSAGQAAAPVTLMEVYAVDPVDRGPLLDAALEQRLIREGAAVLGPWLHGPRKLEAFVRCEPA